MTVKIINFNASLLLILIGVNYVPNLLHCFFVIDVRGAKHLSSIFQHIHSVTHCSVHLTTATVTKFIHVISTHSAYKGHYYSVQKAN